MARRARADGTEAALLMREGGATDTPTATRAWPGSRHRHTEAVGSIHAQRQLMPHVAANTEVSPLFLISFQSNLGLGFGMGICGIWN